MLRVLKSVYVVRTFKEKIYQRKIMKQVGIIYAEEENVLLHLTYL